MGNSGSGGCSIFVVLLLVLVVFGAGYLLAESDQYALQNQVGERALEMTSETIATLVPQATQAAELRTVVDRLQGEVSAAVAAQAQAQEARFAAETARQQAETARAEADAARLRAENDSAAAIAARQQAESNLVVAQEAERRAVNALAVAESSLAKANHKLDVAYGIYTDQQANIDRLQGEVNGLRGELAASKELQIPVTSQVKNLTGKLIRLETLLPMLGIGLLGLVMGIVVTRMAIPTRRGEKAAQVPVVRADSRYTYVKMTREAARQYARQQVK